MLERERVQRGGGRIDMLLTDSENNARFEVEIMLGATDPSHIVRCIEYWDIERRRYPRTIMSPFLLLRILLVAFST